MPVVRVLAGGEDAAGIVGLSVEEVGESMKGLRRISDLTKKFRLRANGGIGKAMPMKAIKGQTMKGRKGA